MSLKCFTLWSICSMKPVSIIDTVVDNNISCPKSQSVTFYFGLTDGSPCVFILFSLFPILWFLLDLWTVSLCWLPTVDGATQGYVSLEFYVYYWPCDKYTFDSCINVQQQIMLTVRTLGVNIPQGVTLLWRRLHNGTEPFQVCQTETQTDTKAEQCICVYCSPYRVHGSTREYMGVDSCVSKQKSKIQIFWTVFCVFMT